MLNIICIVAVIAVLCAVNAVVKDTYNTLVNGIEA